ncbi:hypothetical protein MCW82_02925 [Azospirillum doebereinerae]|nr:hypothetical protein [Azospirillum doebereinerae]
MQRASVILVCDGAGWQTIGIPATDGNWTWDPAQIGTGLVLSDAYKTVSSADYGSVLGLNAISGSKYFELTDVSAGTGGRTAGICVAGATLTHTSFVGDVRGYGYNSNGTKANNASANTFGATFTSGDVVGIAVNTTTNMIWFSKNGVWQGGGDPAMGTSPTFSIQSGYVYYPACYLDGAAGGAVSMRINTGLIYAPPAGFTPF